MSINRYTKVLIGLVEDAHALHGSDSDALKCLTCVVEVLNRVEYEHSLSFKERRDV